MSTNAEDRSPGQVLCSTFGTPQEVERNWFRRVLAGEQAPLIYDPLPIRAAPTAASN